MDDALKQELAKRFSQLPKAVQNAITSADVEKEMRALAERHKLHLDQWQLLENEVLMAILGIKPAQEIVTNIQKEVGVSQEIAAEIVSDITRIVFSPIRGELERELGAPQAQEKEFTDIEKVRTQQLAGEKAQAAVPETLAAPPTPATPPPTEKIARAPASGAYVPGQASIERIDVVDDPYREPPV